MKGDVQAVPAFIYVIIGIFVGLIMLLMVYKYTPIFMEKEKNITLSGNKEKVVKNIAKIIEECWEDNRRGLGDKSNICREVTIENGLDVKEIDVVNFIDCKKLPDSNCYVYPDKSDDCSFCTSPYFKDTDKIYWLAEGGNTGLTISYDGDKRKIIVSGSPCINCQHLRYCKVKCIEEVNDPNCIGVC
ncbi:MAG: hypothetical protein QXY45_00960 [Candidatus Aenigmatarchaeota archaeon]